MAFDLIFLIILSTINKSTHKSLFPHPFLLADDMTDLKFLGSLLEHVHEARKVIPTAGIRIFLKNKLQEYAKSNIHLPLNNIYFPLMNIHLPLKNYFLIVKKWWFFKYLWQWSHSLTVNARDFDFIQMHIH